MFGRIIPRGIINRVAGLSDNSAVASTSSTTTTAVSALVQIRNKRTRAKKGGISPAVQRLITQLSVMSAARKQPKRLKLCEEDIIKHEVIAKAWSLMVKKDQIKRIENLKKQNLMIKEANEDLFNTDPILFNKVKESQLSRFGKRFPLELRIPTNFPPRTIWNYNIKKD